MRAERISSGQEIKETMSKNEIAFAFIKPDFIEDLPEIEKILKENNLEIVYLDKVKLSSEAIDLIYKDSKDQHFFKSMKDYLINHDVIVLLVSGKEQEAQKVLLSLKKDNGQDGIIRQKLQKSHTLSGEDLSLWKSDKHPEQDELSIILTQKNVIHTADNTKEALESLEVIFGNKFEQMKKDGNLPAELWNIFNK